MTNFNANISVKDATGNTSSGVLSLFNGTVTFTTAVVSSNDGSSNAPSGTAQYPTLLNSYAARPSWKVAGVDYKVGLPDGYSLKDPSTIGSSIPGFTYNSGALSTVSNDNTHITGYDFTNTWFLVTGNNCTMDYCSFGAGGISARCNNFTVRYSDFNGSTSSAFIDTTYAPGPTNVFTMEYNRFRNYAQHVLELLGTVTGLVYRYNLIEDGGQGIGAHLNYLQWETSGTCSATVTYNTSIQHLENSGGEGYQFYGDSNTLTAEFGNNVMIAVPGAGNVACMSNMINANGNTPLIINCHDNYFDPTGAFNPFYPGMKTNSAVTTSNWSNNINMVTNAVIAET